MAVYLTESDVADLASMDDAIIVLDDLFQRWGEVRSENVARRRTKMPKGMFNLLGAGYGPKEVFGVKAYFASPAGARFQVLLYSAVSGEMLAVIDAEHLSKLRTGAASGCATRLLAREDAQILGVVGTGQQAFFQVEAACKVRPISEVRIFSRNEESRRRFATDVEKKLHIQAVATPSAESCIVNADIVTTITKSADPVCMGEWIAPGTHINAAGANAANRSELDDLAVLKAQIKSTDSLSQAKVEAGEYASLVRSGRLEWSEVVELGDIASSATPARTSPEQITLFKSLGVGIEDVAFAEWIYRRAISMNCGLQLPF